MPNDDDSAKWSSRKNSSHRAPVVSIDSGDHRARVIARSKALQEEYAHLVPPIANWLRRRAPKSFSIKDLISAGHVGLAEAALAYRPSAHGDTPFPAFAKKRIRGAILNSFSRDNYKNATQCELLGDRVIEMPARPTENPDDRVLISKIRGLIAILPPQERAVMEMRFSAAEPNLRKIGNALGVSKTQAIRLQDSALAYIRDVLAVEVEAAS